MNLDEVKCLPDKSVVDITWSGGNGPHRYVVWWSGSSLLAYLPQQLDQYCGEVCRVEDRVLINKVAKVDT